MSTINGLTMARAIRAVDREMTRLHNAVDAADSQDVDDVNELMSYIKAAEDLKRAYIEVCKTTINLPPYESLVEN